MGARAWPLASLAIAVGGGGHPLAGPRGLTVDPDAHRAARLPPLEARLGEDAVEPLNLGRLTDEAGARHDPRRHHGASSLRHTGGGAEILQPAVRARADEDAIDRHVG